MNAQQHIPVDDLAAYAAGDLDAAAGVAVEAHLLLCADCRSDVEAITSATAALTGVERPVMPADVAARIDAALAAERSAPSPGGDIVPMPPKRRRPSFAGIAAVAAGVALVAAISVPFLNDGGDKAADTAARPGAGTATTHRLASGLDYTHQTLAATLNSALSGTTEKSTLAGGVSAPGAVNAPGAPSTAPRSSSGGVAADTSADFSALAPLQQNAGRLAACITSLATGLPPVAAVPLVVDFAQFAGKPAVVVAFATVSGGQVRSDKIDVFVVGPACGITPGDDNVLDFARIPRPKL